MIWHQLPALDRKWVFRTPNSGHSCGLAQFTDTAVSCLPREKVQQSSQWLSNKAKADPEYTVAYDLAVNALHPLQSLGACNQRNLYNHTNKRHA
jgi:hypothetical protein